MSSTSASLRALAALLLLPSCASTLQVQPGQNSSQPASTGLPPCDALVSAGLGHRVLFATDDQYEPRIGTWMSANAQFRPWCLVQPHTASEVSAVVSALAASGEGAGDWHVAIRGGGNGPPGSSNIDNGVTIDLGMMNRSSHDPATGLASVEPGAAWMDVYADLQNTANVTVVGGRSGGVGVGGFLLGGGNSFYTGRFGFGCDTVMGFQVVLANGTIVEATADENPDLWRALKGGGSNFGIVTRFDLETIPAHELLAHGESIVDSSYSDEVFDALADFTDHSQEHPEDAMFALLTHSPGSEILALITCANTLGNLNSKSFDRINKIPTIVSTWERKSHATIAREGQLPAGSLIGAENYTTAFIYQPLPAYFSQIGHRKGGNVMGLGQIQSNAILFQSGIAIYNGDEAALAYARVELHAMIAKLQEAAVAEGVAAGWVYMNYADASQNPLGGSGEENVAFMRQVADMYDPEGWWQRRVPGGFKLARVT
ncbi:hypothetical protein S40288_07713 [Stachybotrys chartarum IBT 40288]|nr:hypothetical protein S40288_07713 [Stachybotrys chartarum IBT 40288]